MHLIKTTKPRKLSILFIILVLFSIGLMALRHGKWNRYYKNKIGLCPHQIITDALNLFPKEGKAIDLGCGIGNEVVLLLNKGWKVWAVDGESRAIQMMKKRSDITQIEKLDTVASQFEKEATWTLLPQVDFLYAAYALPFCKPSEFYRVWDHIQQKIHSEGRFAGHFFGPNYRGFTSQEMKNMTFLNKEEVWSLFQDFDIERFKEIEEDGQSGTGLAIHSHIFEVIARKR